MVLGASFFISSYLVSSRLVLTYCLAVHRAGLKNQDNLFEVRRDLQILWMTYSQLTVEVQQWYAQIDGPADSIYDGGVFDIE
jgi:hypothetical protein